MNIPRILVVDDDDAFRSMLADSLNIAGFDTITAKNSSEALSCLDVEPGMVFLDLKMDGDERSGIVTLNAIRQRYPSLPVIMLTGYGDVQTAVAAMKAGALDFIEKPVDIDTVRRIAVELLLTNDDGEDIHSNDISFGGIITSECSMIEAVSLLSAAAETDSPVLISGESGTGKELAVDYLHNNSRRKKKPLVKVNCSAIPNTLVESEIFGAEAGAYTGASKPREGRFAAAEGGTLFLDEIAEMDVAVQAKLLRVLQEKVYEPVGSMRSRKADVRIIAATNQPIKEAVREGRFREDLYFRLNIFHIEMPPLRERPGDILPLARHFLTENTDDRPRRLSVEVEEILTAYHWPGNIRELRNAMERGRILARGGLIKREHLPPDIAATEPGFPVRKKAEAVLSVNEMEKQLVISTLEETNGNRTEAAKRMGMSRRALLYKIKRFGIANLNKL